MTTTTELSENSHQGFEGLKAHACLASMDAKSNNASGLRPCLRREGIGSRSSGKERDETGLDFFDARYFSSALGRFTRPDPLGGNLSDPQTLNKYSYVRNNPINLTDPTGMYICYGDEKCESQEWKDFEAERQKNLESDDLDVVRAAEAYGDPTINNGVTVKFEDPGNDKDGDIVFDTEDDPSNKESGMRAKLTISIKPGLTGARLGGAIAHEGGHAADAQAFIGSMTASGINYDLNLYQYDFEGNGLRNSQSVFAREGFSLETPCGGTCLLGATNKINGKANTPDAVINRILDKSYGVTPQNPGRRMYPRIVPPEATPPQ